jgi:hypothetical protein
MDPSLVSTSHRPGMSTVPAMVDTVRSACLARRSADPSPCSDFELVFFQP